MPGYDAIEQWVRLSTRYLLGDARGSFWLPEYYEHTLSHTYSKVAANFPVDRHDLTRTSCLTSTIGSGMTDDGTESCKTSCTSDYDSFAYAKMRQL